MHEHLMRMWTDSMLKRHGSSIQKQYYLAFFPILLLAMAANTFRFANMFGDHMVLQRAPKPANIWGYIGVISGGCDQITVTFNGQTATAKLIQGEGGAKIGTDERLEGY